MPNSPLAGAQDSAREMLAAGGPVVALLAALSVLALAIVLVKLWQFRRARLADLEPARLAARLHRTGRSIEALDVAERSPHPAALGIAGALRGVLRDDVAPETAREEAFRLAGDRLEALRAYLRPLEVIAALSPLLGLFGTVLGMIEAFQALEAAGSQVDPAILSGGIWEALMTTAAGLAVAMPAIAALNWLERRVDRAAHASESLIVQVFTPDLSHRAPAREPRWEEDEDAAAQPGFVPLRAAR